MLRTLMQAVLGMAVIATGFAAGALTSGVDSRLDPTLTATSTLSPVLTDGLEPTPVPTSTPSPYPSASPPRTPFSTPMPAATATTTPTPSRTSTVTPTPTYDPPDARVLQQANCRYGPGAAYLYEWGLYERDRVEIHGRNELGTWVYVDPWTYVDRCWVKANLLDVFRGDILDAPFYYGRLPLSDLYLPPTNPYAVRHENWVTITWDPVWMTDDDDRGYLIETWVCRDRHLVFTPIHVDYPPAAVEDEAGCVEASSGRLYTAEKHGYTQWVLVPWPAHPGS